jgi:1,4-alpha-glucan branching enzyme
MVRLPELTQLGINAIEIMPLGQFPGTAGTGYNPGYIFAVDNDYGGPDGFRTYVNATHSQNIAVILDGEFRGQTDLTLWANRTSLRFKGEFALAAIGNDLFSGSSLLRD